MTDLGETPDFLDALVFAPGPTAARVVSFTATPGREHNIQLTWRTGSEIDNLGFNVYRELAGQRVKLNPALIAGAVLLIGPGMTLTTGHSYVWWDEARQGTPDARYWLEDVDLSGQRTWHRPVAIVPARHSGPLPPVGQGQAALFTSQGQGAALQPGSEPARRHAIPIALTAAPATTLAVRGEATPSRTPAALVAAVLSTEPWSPADQGAIKLAVRQEGWYRVTQPELLAAGLDPHVDPRLLHMYVDGQAILIRVTGEGDGQFDPGDTIEF